MNSREAAATWQGVLPSLLNDLRSGDDAVRKDVEAELLRLAVFADQMNKTLGQDRCEEPRPMTVLSAIAFESNLALAEGDTSFIPRRVRKLLDPSEQ